MKVSQVKRRIKRRSERKSRQNNKANLVRSRKQRARKTARKMMRGGAGDANVVDDAISLKFSGKDKLFISIDIDKYKGDVRRTLDLLFHIDGFNPIKTHNQTFLMGLADYPGRERTKQLTLTEVTNGDCGDVYDGPKTKVQKLIDNTFSKVNVCDLEIELKEVNGDITCIVKKYHRMKIGETYCRVKEIESGPGDNYKVLNVYTKGLFYPKLEFADSNPKGLLGVGGGVDYMDSITGSVYRNEKNNLFTFTVKGKTIENLKSELINLKSITAAIEEQKTKEAAEAEEQKTKEAAEAEEARKKKVETEFDKVSPNNNDFKEAIKVISPFISWIIDWRQENNCKYNYNTDEEEVIAIRNKINEAFETKYTPEERVNITNSLKICRKEYRKLLVKEFHQPIFTSYQEIFREYFKSMYSMNYIREHQALYNLYLAGLEKFDKYLILEDKDAVNEITALWNTVFYVYVADVD
jgi:hypothetical protein